MILLCLHFLIFQCFISSILNLNPLSSEKAGIYVPPPPPFIDNSTIAQLSPVLINVLNRRQNMSSWPQPLRISQSLAMADFSMKSFALVMWWRMFEACSQISYLTDILNFVKHWSNVWVYFGDSWSWPAIRKEYPGALATAEFSVTKSEITYHALS